MKSGIALKKVEGNVTTSATERTAWYLCAPARWSFRSTSECNQLIASIAQRLSELGGRRLRLRVTSRPYAVAEWAAALDAQSPNALPGWADHLLSQQRHLGGMVLAEKLAFVGVDLKVPASKRRRTEMADEVAEVDAVMAAAGMDAEPATSADLEYLIQRSVALGMPAPLEMPPAVDVLEETDLPEITDGVEWTCAPYGRSVKVTAEVNGERVDRHVVVLVAGRMQPLDIPEGGEPWLQRPDRLPFPVEISAEINVLENEKVTKGFNHALALVRSQTGMYLEHHLDPPSALERQRQTALALEDQVSAGYDGLQARTETWVRYAVSGATEAEALDRARQLAKLYAPGITLVRPSGQFGLAEEFVPGSPRSSDAHKRHLPVLHVGTAVPQAAAMIGDKDGPYLGRTAGTSQRPVMWNPHAAMEVRERSGLLVVAGTLGSGKSTLLGKLAHDAVIRGIPTTLLDPSGRLKDLTKVPAIVAVSRHIDLMNAEAGALSPYRVVPEPQEAAYTSHAAYTDARAGAEAERQELCEEILLTILPASLADMPATLMVVGKAVRSIRGLQTTNPHAVIEALRHVEGSNAEHASDVAEVLDGRARSPLARLIFPPNGYVPPETGKAPLLTVITMAGIALPQKGSKRQDWTTAERFAVVQLRLAASLATRSIYSTEPNARKMLMLDEAWALTLVDSGKAFIERVCRDSRKVNLRVCLASQDAMELVAAGVANWVDAALIGTTTGADAQRDALSLLGVETGCGYEAILGGLSLRDRRSGKRSPVRDWVFQDGNGGLEVIRPDISGTPELMAALDTTADPTKVAASNGHLTLDDAKELMPV
jgi:hypothetical protein